MKRTITINIGGNDYRLVSAESDEYIEKITDLVDGKIRELLSLGNVTSIDAAILTSVNLADEYLKALETADTLRAQVKDYLEESSRLKVEIADLRRRLDNGR